MQGNSGIFRAVLLFAVLFPATFVHAQMRERYTAPDRGQSRSFVVAHDELHVTGPVRGTRAEAISGVRSAEGARAAAERLRTARGETASVVLYEEGRPRSPYTRRILTEKITVELAPGADGAAIAASLGLIDRGPVRPGWRFHIFETRRVGGALEAAEKLRTVAGVVSAEAQLARLYKKRFTPNDPFFSSQWHLANSFAGPTVNITTAWDNWKGAGIRIGIVDDGLQVTHEDLVANVDTANDRDWNDTSVNDPSPNVSADFHGTSCAGVAAGRGNNGIGISGAAPEATLVGLRLIATLVGDTEESEATSWRNDIIQIKSNSWGPDDDGLTLAGPGSLTRAALLDAVTNGRGGRGTIFTWAAGNGGDVGDNSNYDGYANSIYTIAVAALADDGTRSSYSEPGANLTITAPSDGGTRGITTADLTGANGYNTNGSGNLSNTNYTNDFGGTSSACPLAAGVIALMLQSKPTLGWRDVKDILIRSATKCDSTDTDWVNNGAGLHFNHKYGAGLIDAAAALARAATHVNLPAMQSAAVQPTTTGTSNIPDNNATGVTRTFNVTQNLRTEHVTVAVNITHARRGQLTVTLTSPSGTVSRLAEVHQPTVAQANYANWTFMTVRNWGETSAGTWTLRITDTTSATTGTFDTPTLTVYGTPANAPPVVSAATISPTGTVFSDQALGVSGVSASDAENDAISLSYQWERSGNGTTFTAISGATSTTYALTGADSGNVVRCAVTATSGGQNSAPFYTSAVAVDRRPGQLARHGVAYSYDSDLFLAGGSSGSFARAAILNEFSQGSTANREWVELLVTQANADLRGWTFGDAGGVYTTFANTSFWSALPLGTLIVLYNGAERDGVLPADDFDASDGRLVIAHSNATYFTAGTWAGLANTAGDSLLLRNASAALVDGLSYGSTSGQTPQLGAVGGGLAAQFRGDSDAAAEVATDWSIISQSATTPGAANGGANTTLITSLRASAAFRFAAASESVPGLTIDSISGLVSGTPNISGGGFFNVIVERFSGTNSVTRSYSLLVADASGNYVVPAGRTWTLNADAALPGNLTVLGTIDTAGRSLTVAGRLTTGGTITNPSGLITFLNLTGTPPSGATALLVNAANDVADADGDRLPNLLEHLLGTDPSAAGPAPVVTSQTIGGQLRLTVNLPSGKVGVTPVVEVSADLVNWFSGSGFTQVTGDSTSGGVRTLTVQSVSNAAPLFIRLRASR